MKQKTTRKREDDGWRWCEINFGLWDMHEWMRDRKLRGKEVPLNFHSALKPTEEKIQLDSWETGCVKMLVAVHSIILSPVQDEDKELCTAMFSIV